LNPSRAFNADKGCARNATAITSRDGFANRPDHSLTRSQRICSLCHARFFVAITCIDTHGTLTCNSLSCKETAPALALHGSGCCVTDWAARLCFWRVLLLFQPQQCISASGSDSRTGILCQ